MMINHIQMNRMNPSAFSSLTGEAMGMPETGEFDFLNYLLGLQVSPIENGIEVDGDQVKLDNNSAELVESDKKLLELFSKKKETESPWLLGQNTQNSIQPGNTVSLPDIQVSELPSPRDLAGETQQIKPASLEKSKEVKANQLSEDPLAKLTFDASVKQKDGKSLLESQQVNIKAETKVKKGETIKLEHLVEKPITDMPKIEAKGEVKVEKGRRKDSDQLEVVIDDKNLVNIDRASESSSKEVPISKVVHNHAPELFHKVETMVHKGGGKMTLSLTPPELGQVEIEVTTKGKNVEVSVKSDNDFAKAAIESQVADLQQSLKEQDLNLSKIEVQVSREMDPSFLENQFAGFSRQGSFYQQSQGFSQDSFSKKSWELAPEETVLRPVAVAQKSQMGNSRVDIRI